jgi:hypothetical protein
LSTPFILRWPLKEIAQASGASLAHLRELVDKRVMKGVDKGDCEGFVYVPRSGRKDGEPVTLIVPQGGPIWYSTRMVRDEYVRTIRAESGGNGVASKATPKPPKGESKGPRDSSSSPTVLNTSDPDGSGAVAPPPPPSDLFDDPRCEHHDPRDHGQPLHELPSDRMHGTSHALRPLRPSNDRRHRDRRDRLSPGLRRRVRPYHHRHLLLP